MSDSDADSVFDVPPLQTPQEHSQTKRSAGPRDSFAVSLAKPGEEEKIVKAWRRVRWSTQAAVEEPTRENVRAWEEVKRFITKYRSALEANTARRDELIKWLGPDGVQKSFEERVGLLDDIAAFYDPAQTSHQNVNKRAKAEISVRKRKMRENREEEKKMFEDHLQGAEEALALLVPESKS